MGLEGKQRLTYNNHHVGEMTVGRGKTVYEGSELCKKQAHLEGGGE